VGQPDFGNRKLCVCTKWSVESKEIAELNIPQNGRRAWVKWAVVDEAHEEKSPGWVQVLWRLGADRWICNLAGSQIMSNFGCPEANLQSQRVPISIWLASSHEINYCIISRC
jgi:hypothetical protein